jgi:hypothetical protein
MGALKVEKPPESQIGIYNSSDRIEIEIPQIFPSISPCIYPKLLLVLFLDILSFILIAYGCIFSTSIKTHFFVGFILWLFLFSISVLNAYIVDELMANTNIVIRRDMQIKFKRHGYVRKIGYPPSITRIISIINHAQLSNNFPLKLPFFQTLQLECRNKVLNLSWLLTKDENIWLEYEINNFINSIK